MLLEREHELDELAGALRQACCGHGGMILVRGPLGCGKSSLLRALPALAGDDVRVMKAGSSCLEQDSPFGVVRELIEPVLSSASPEVRDRWLAGVAGQSRMIFTKDPPAGTSAARQRDGVLPSLITLIGNISTDTPLLLLLDDIQWLDVPSSRLITMLARQSHRMRVLIVATMRDGDIRTNHASIAELTAAASRELRPERLSATAISPVAGHVSWLRTLRPSELRERLVHCLELQAPQVRAFARAFAVLGELACLDLVGRLAGLDPVSCREATRTMQQLGLLTDEGGVGFTHPVVRDAIEATSTTADREELHLEAVRLLHHSDYPAEQVAARLLETTSKQTPWAVEILRSAADTAVRRGEPEVAARYLRRALLDASLDGEDRARLLVELSTVERGFDPTAAIRHISDAVPLLPTARDKASAVVQVSPVMLIHDPLPLRDLMAEVAAELGAPGTLTGVDRDLALRLETRLRYSAQQDPAELGDTVRRLSSPGPAALMDTSAERELLTVLLHAATLTTQLPAVKVAELATGILDREKASPAHVRTALPLLVTILAGADEVAPLLPWLDTSLDKAQAQQAGIEQALIRAEQALALLYAGRAGEARSAASEVAALDWVWTSAAASTALSAVALELRDPELTNRVLAGQSGRTDSHCLLLRASVAASAGDFRQALEHTLDCGRRLDRAGWRNTVLFPWQTNAAVLHFRLGDTDSAVRYAEEARVRAARWGAPSGIGRALRTLGQVLPGEPGTELLREAVSTLEFSGNVLELAKAQVRLGERLHLAGDPTAADFLREAYMIAVDSGDPRLAARASRKLTR